jgi:hypothetical protein
MRLSPNNLLDIYTRDLPGVWKKADKERQHQMGAPRHWPNYCFLPSNIWPKITRQVFKSYEDARIYGTTNTAALGAWRYTQGIYRFNTETFDALVSTPFDGMLPTEVLLRLPEWCVYIETPGMIWADDEVYGFFAFLDYDTRKGRTSLQRVDATEYKRRYSYKWLHPMLVSGFEKEQDDGQGQD